MAIMQASKPTTSRCFPAGSAAVIAALTCGTVRFVPLVSSQQQPSRPLP